MFKLKNMWIVSFLSLAVIGSAGVIRSNDQTTLNTTAQPELKSNNIAILMAAFAVYPTENKSVSDVAPEVASDTASAPSSTTVQEAQDENLAAYESYTSATVLIEENNTEDTVDVPSTSSSTVTQTSEAPTSHACSIWESQALAAGWDISDLSILYAIMYAESRCDPEAVSHTGDYGLMQINWYAHSESIHTRGLVQADLFNPTVNLSYALEIALYAENYSGCKWQPWYSSGYWC